MKNKKFGLITIMKSYQDVFGYTHIIFCKDNQVSCFIMNQDESVDLTIEELMINFKDKLLTKSGKFKDYIFETDMSYIDLKEGFIQFPTNARIEFYGYGNTPQESVQDCINHFEYLQKTYNKENISI